MKITNRNDRERSKATGIGSACKQTCRKVIRQIARAKESVRAEWADVLKAQQQAVRLALNEAEALAWETLYPHLVFPVLATEKVQAVAAWNKRQQQIWWKDLTAGQ